MQGTLGPAREVVGEPLDVFLSSRDPAGLRDALAAHGVRLHEGGTLRARLPLAVLSQVSASFDRAELTPPMWPLLDKSVHEIAADAVHAGMNLQRARKGKGVLVGVLDTGIDLTHPAFLDAQGRSRIIAVWDQDAEGPGPVGFGYGRVCNREEINSGACPVSDPQAHGTHVAGILAGAMHPHIGVAPEAEIVVVKSTRFTDVAGAIEWMFRVARAEGKPIVANLSIGGHLGAHDGQSELERSLVSLQGPGKIIVTAAGNDGATPIHLRALRSDDEQRSELHLPNPGAETATMLEIWEHGRTSPTFALEAYDFDGNLLGRRDAIDGEMLPLSGAKFGYQRDDATPAGRTHHLVTVDLSAAPEDAAFIRYVLVWRSERMLDMWISTDDYRYGAAEFATAAEDLAGFVAGDSRMTLTIPGTARDLITVGAYVTKNQWETELGRVYRISSAQIAALASFSSIGPTAAPALTGEKPDLIAPGQLIAGPLASSAAGVGSLAIDSHFAVMQGTSMSAPHVAGTVALMLEEKPDLSPEEAKTLLVETATNDTMLGSIPNSESGFGRLNAHDAVARLQGTERTSSGCNHVPLGDGMTLLTMMIVTVMAQQLYARRLRLFRLRALKNTQG